MNHAFVSMGEVDRCVKCKYPAKAHTSQAECECCPNIGPVEIRHGNVLMCDECWSKELNTVKTLSTSNPASPYTAEQLKKHQEFRERMQAESQRHLANVIVESRVKDEEIVVKTDIFNAATTSIIELKTAIDGNDEITNKPYALASELKSRFEHYQAVVFRANNEIIEAGNNQKAIQVYLNNLANQLKQEEREKLKIQDINYKPTDVKQPKIKKIGTSQTKKSTKIDKVELKKYAKELGISEFMLQQIVVAKGISVSDAANILKKSIADAKAAN